VPGLCYGPAMPPYRDLSGASGVAAFAEGGDWIEVTFKTGGTYRYSHAKPGRAHVDRMKRLAHEGRGLSTYISQYVRERYESRR